MTHTYTVSGMTCTGCQAKVQQVLSQVPGVKNVAIDLQKNEATVEMDKHIATTALQAALQPYPKYSLAEKEIIPVMHTAPIPAEEQKSWLQTYKPILLVLAYILGGTLLVQAAQG